MLTTSQRKRYARQLLLAEIGERGQAALCASRVRIEKTADARAAAVAADYLERAGVALFDANVEAPDAVGNALHVASSEQVRALAGHAQLHEAAAALAGSFAAVEAIKSALGVGEPARIANGLSLVATEWSAS